MNTELTMLTYAVALLILLVFIQANAGVLAHGSKTMAGSRDDMPPLKTFPARAKRTVDNHVEGLAMFAPLALIAASAHVTNQWTVLGAELFFYSRLAHAALYLAGVPWIRPVAWLIGFIGTVMLLLALLGIVK
jgi:uncharacterized MAPEG superfamily protein